MIRFPRFQGSEPGASTEGCARPNGRQELEKFFKAADELEDNKLA
jgi:hypothetical protein